MLGRHLVLTYDYVPDILQRREPYRADHLAAARERLERGELLAAGALGDPVHGAAFVFTGIDRDEVERFVTADPYVLAGLVTGWRIDPWNVVVAEGS